MTRLRVVSHTGAMSAVVLLVPEPTAIQAHVGCGTASNGVSSNSVNTFGWPLGSGPSPCRTIHALSDLSVD
jgi:hypothetical protein